MTVQAEVLWKVPAAQVAQLGLVGGSDVGDLCLGQLHTRPHPHDGAHVGPGAHEAANVDQQVALWVASKQRPGLVVGSAKIPVMWVGKRWSAKVGDAAAVYQY